MHPKELRKDLAIVGIFLIIATLALVLMLRNARPELFAGARPAGATDSGVLAASLQAIRRCTTTTDAIPAGCPQTGTVSSPVRWKLWGDPTSGAIVRYLGGDQFDASGPVVMQESYSGGSNLVQDFYRANVEWVSDHLVVTDLSRWVISLASVARPAFATDQAALMTVYGALGTCGCVAKPAGTPASSTLTVEPSMLRNSTVSYVGSFGTLEVKGPVTVDFTWSAGGQKKSSSTTGNLTATLIPQGGQLVVPAIDLKAIGS